MGKRMKSVESLDVYRQPQRLDEYMAIIKLEEASH